MPVPGPGVALPINAIVAEFGGAVPHSLSEYYRGGGLVPNAPQNVNIASSGAINMGSFYGATNRISVPLTISSNTYNYDVFTNRSPAYVAGISDITVTVNPGVTVGSSSTGAYAMLVPSAFNPGDTIRIVNNGTIQGMGGAGGGGGPAGAAVGGNPSASPGGGGGTGGNAVYVNRPVVFTNNGTLAGGGGGGGGGGGASGSNPKGGAAAGGGGGGGGAGFNGGGGGAGGSPGGSTASSGNTTSGGGGAGGGSSFSPQLGTPVNGGSGGTGGGRGASGSSGGPGGTGFGGARALGSGAGGGAAGNYIVGNSFVTWPATGTRQGGVA